MFPFIKSYPTYTLNVPSITGGLNLRDGLSRVNDNQMTDAKNVWYKDGALRTRPRVRAYNDNDLYWYNKNALSDGSVTVFADPQHVVKRKNSNVEYSYAVVVAQEFIEGVGDLATVKFLYFSGGDNFDNPSRINAGEITFEGIYIDNVFSIECEGVFYSFVSGHQIGTNDEPSRLGIFKSDIESPQKLVEMEDEQFYQPVVIINAVPSANEMDEINGTGIYSYNIFSKRYKIECTLPKSIEGDLDTFFYKLPFPVSYSNKKDGKTHYTAFDYTSGEEITAEITYDDGSVVKHSCLIGRDLANYGFMENNQQDVGGVANTDGYIMCVRDATICFYTKSGDTYKLACPSVSVITPNNMVISSIKKINEDDIMKIFSMTKSVWYGGNAEGLYGGTRLFIGGNTSKSDGALMMWSDLNNPLYFPQYNYAYVGSPSKRLTAFGRQGESLVILKEKEIHQIPYVTSLEITLEQLQQYSVIDLASQSIAFPIYQVHGYIGCDCPNTVQLCRNRLVWANSDGKVYSLITENQYNERAVFEVSEMIAPMLKAKNLHYAFSADWDDHYVLITGNNIFVMDYNSYGFNYVSSFSKVEDANIKIPWYYWQINVDALAVIVNSGKLMFVVKKDISALQENALNGFGMVVSVHYLDGSKGDDDICEFEFRDGDYILVEKPQPIESMVRTKLYDFNQPSKLKTVSQIYLTFGYNNYAPIRIDFLSEKNIVDEHTIVIEGEKAEEYSPDYIKPFRLFPYTRNTVNFGAKIVCHGELVIDSISLQYKTQGGAK